MIFNFYFIEFDADAFLASLAEPPKCPVHKEVSLMKLYNQQGWEYFLCDTSESYTPCFVTCGVEHADKYLREAEIQLKECYKTNLPDMRCFCNKGLIMKLSKSEKNPDRLYLMCRQKDRRCQFFQWVDEEPRRPEIREVLRL